MNELIFEEVEVLTSIYEASFILKGQVESNKDRKFYSMTYCDENRKLSLHFLLSDAYPNELSSLEVHVELLQKKRKDFENIACETFHQSLGEPSLFRIIEEIKS